MRNSTTFLLSVGLAALASACGGAGTGDDAGAGGGTGTGTGTDTGAGAGSTGTGATGSACALVTKGAPVSEGLGAAPSLLWTGDQYAVAWTDTSKDDGDIHLAMIGPDGAKKSEVEIDSGAAVSSHVSVVRAGDGLVVLWQDAAGAGSVVRGRRVNMDGQVQGNAFQLAQSGVAEAWPVGASAEAGIAVAWMDTGRAHVGFLGADSALSGTVPVDGGMFPWVTADGAELGMAWSTGAQISFARPTVNGPMNPVHHPGVNALLTRVAMGGSSAFLTWEDIRDGEGSEQIFLVRVEEGGAVSNEVVVPADGGSANWPAMVWTGSHVAVAYYQWRDGPPAVFLELFKPDLTSLKVDLEVSGEAGARFPALAWTGEEIGVAYAEKDGGIFLSTVSCPQ